MVTNDSVVTAITAIQTLIKNSGDKIVESTSKYGPEVINIAENYIRLIAIISTIPYLIVTIIAVLVMKNAIRTYKKYRSIHSVNFNKNVHIAKYAGITVYINFCIIIVCILSLIIAIYNIIKVDNVLSIVYPKMELIKLAKDSIVNNIAAK